MKQTLFATAIFTALIVGFCALPTQTVHAQSSRSAVDAAALKKANAELDRMIARQAKERSSGQSANKTTEYSRRKSLSTQRTKDLAESKRISAEKRASQEKARKLAAEKRIQEFDRLRAEEEKLRVARQIDSELVDRAIGRETTTKPVRFGFFGRRQRNQPAESGTRASAMYDTAPETFVVASPPNRYLYINEAEVNNLNSSNAKIEIDISEQRAKIFNGSTLVIETQISTGKSGHSTSTGYFSVSEKIIDKKSGRYGTWYDSSGNKLKGDDSRNPPARASKFIGADMPYWLRVNGGIGMHIGFVPDYPASHGCIRVPSNIQPLIYSKVRVGTPVHIKY